MIGDKFTIILRDETNNNAGEVNTWKQGIMVAWQIESHHLTISMMDDDDSQDSVQRVLPAYPILR